MTTNAIQTTSKTSKIRRSPLGFSLLELLVAMMILAVLGTIGFTQFRKNSAQARHIKAQSDLKIVAEGLDQYYLKHGRFPDFGSFNAMIEGNSPLVKESLIKVDMSPNDPFGQPYEGKSTSGNYELKCLGDPNNPEDLGPIMRTPGQGQTVGSGPAAGSLPATPTEPGDKK